MIKKISLTIGAALTIFLISYGVILANESFNTQPEPQNSKEEKNHSQGDEKLGSLSEKIAKNTDEEFPILERDQKKFEELAVVQEPDVEPLTPAALTIPSLEINADVISVGLLEDGAMEVPENVNEVGWFEPGIKPGQIGNAVLAGHVDSYEGPAIFFELRDLQKGDEIIVTGEKGEELTFAVTSLESYATDAAPIEKIFGPSDSRHLNLITCTGSFNRDSGEYPDRLVVYTELVKDEPEELEYTPTPPEKVELSGTQLSWHAVRDQEVVGYRVYEELEDGSKDLIDSISYFERKSIIVENGTGSYSVTSVSIDGKESEHAQISQ